MESKTMRTILIYTILAASVLASAPAAAQYRGEPYGDYGYRNGAGIERQIDEIKRRIDRARDHRAISREEARRLRYQADQLDRLADRVRRGGVSPREARYLQERVDRLRQQLRFERRDWNRHVG
jgi:hypothetical protein